MLLWPIKELDPEGHSALHPLLLKKRASNACFLAVLFWKWIYHSNIFLKGSSSSVSILPVYRWRLQREIKYKYHRRVAGHGHGVDRRDLASGNMVCVTKMMVYLGQERFHGKSLENYEFWLKSITIGCFKDGGWEWKPRIKNFRQKSVPCWNKSKNNCSKAR